MKTEIFAKELRKQCARFSSISQVCEGANINRQQFNKYLAGQMLPSARSLRKICSFLGISEQELLSGGPPTNSHSTLTSQAIDFPQYMGTDEMLTIFATQKLERMTGGVVKSGAIRVQPGFYYCYFPLFSDPAILARSLVSVRQRNGALSFTRRTYVPASEGGCRIIARGKHSGVILCGSTEVYLLAVNRRQPHQLSCITLDVNPSLDQDTFAGLALTRKVDSWIASNVVMQYLGRKLVVRNVLRGVGPVAIDHSSVDPTVRMLMSANTTIGQNQIIGVNAYDLLRSGARDGAHRSWQMRAVG